MKGGLGSRDGGSVCCRGWCWLIWAVQPPSSSHRLTSGDLLISFPIWSHFQFEPFPAQRLLLPLHLRPSEREEAVYLARSHLSPRYSAHLKCNCHVWTAPLFDSLNSGLRGGNEGEVRGVRREEMERLLLKSWLMETLSSRSRQRRSWKSDWKPNLATPMQGRKGKAAQSVPKLPGHNM